MLNDAVRFMPQWENSGSTSANPAQNAANWKTFTGAPPADYRWPDLDENGNELAAGSRGDAFYMGPRSTKYSFNCDVPLWLMEEVRAGRRRLFLWGWIEYGVAFGGITPRRTEFCNEVVVTDLGRDAQGRVIVAMAFTTFGPYNTAT